LKKWNVVLEKIKIRNFEPLTGRKGTVKRKQDLAGRLEIEIGKDLPKIQKRTRSHPLFVDVCFYLYLSNEEGSSKKDLDNLLKILFDVLSDNMVHGQKPIKGLSLMKDDSYVQKIKCEKIIVNSKERAGIDLLISKGI